MKRACSFIGALAVLGAALVPAVAATPEEHYKFLHAKCGPALKMSESECDCIVATAKSELKGKELDMVVSMVKNDPAGIATLQSQLTAQQMNRAMNFVTQTPTKCRNQ